MESSKTKNTKIIQRILAIIIGNLLCSIAINSFYIPNGMLSGGISGISILFNYLGNIPTGLTAFVLNIIILIIGLKRLDKDYAIYGFISMITFSVMVTLTEFITSYFIVEDILLATVFGGIINGLGMGIMIKNKAPQGGFDIIAIILKKKYNINVGSGLMIINTFLISLSSLIFGYSRAMYTIIAMFIGYKVLDKVQIGFNNMKEIMIISDKPETITKEIIEKLGRGVTYIEGEGAYTNADKKIIMCIISSQEIVKIKDIIGVIDKEAFIIINEVVEVIGRGFQSS